MEKLKDFIKRVKQIPSVRGFFAKMFVGLSAAILFVLFSPIIIVGVLSFTAWDILSDALEDEEDETTPMI